MKRTLFTLLALLVSSLRADIHEVKHFSEIFEYLTPDTLVVIDIDNTIMEPVQMLGSDQWFYYQMDVYHKSGMSYSDALEKALSEWHAIQNVTQVKLVEPNTDEVIQKIQNDNYSAMGLTTRGLGLSTCTNHQLARLGVNLSKTAPTCEEVFIKNPHGVLFVGGTLYTAGTNKGNAFKKFLAAINYQPKRVLFINDKLSHLKDLEKGCDALGIPFIGLRYSASDATVNGFRPDVADIQFENFGKILSDKEAEDVLKATGS